ncbi:MAG: DNA-protecting protein DprA [Caldilineae bacterium]|nr:MAG: DNA-protecting protein DprA [Caldilineae bacterium]
MERQAYWIGFNCVPGVGPARLAALLEVCDDIEAAWKAPIQQLRQAGFDRRTLESMLAVRRTIDLEAEWARVQRAGVRVFTWEDPDYPANLRQLPGAPPVLYARGQLLPEDELAVAVVGTRQASAYGREVAHTLATELAHNQVTVVSGLALGVDTVAHQAALDAGGRTLAVLGSGVDQIYPARNRKLATQILETGAILSEYPLGTKPEASNFPPRNRIISGLSLAVVVVEAGERSGALITARFAAEQGRDVFAVPGSILHPSSAGCNALLQEGAIPLVSISDVLDQLHIARTAVQHQARQVLPADPMEALLLEHLTREPRHVDEIVRDASMPPAQVNSLLAMMELKGLVRQVGGMRYVRNE